MESDLRREQSKEQAIEPYILAAIVQIQISELLRQIDRQEFFNNMNA